MDYNPNYDDDDPQDPSSIFLIPHIIPATLAESSTLIDRVRDREDRDRLPQWTPVETEELLTIRAELDRSFTATRRNRRLWEAIATRMQRRGFVRTPEQCKSKWKNLVTRYKGSEAMEGIRQFAFREEMRNIFSDRADRLLHLDKGKLIKADSEVLEEEGKSKKKRKRKGGEIEKALKDFARKQVEREMRLMEAVEAREAERRWKEEEWMREMVALHEERLAMERRWMEKEEERWAREEERDERRHAIITAILSKIGDI